MDPSPNVPLHQSDLNTDLINNRDVEAYMRRTQAEQLLADNDEVCQPSSENADTPPQRQDSAEVRSVISGKDLLSHVHAYHPLERTLLEEFAKNFQSKKEEDLKSYARLVVPHEIRLELNDTSGSDSDGASSSQSNGGSTTGSIMAVPLLKRTTMDSSFRGNFSSFSKKIVKWMISIRVLLASWVCLLLILLGFGIYFVLQQTIKNFAWDQNSRLHLGALNELRTKVFNEGNAQFSAARHLNLAFKRSNVSTSVFLPSQSEQSITELFTNEMALFLEDTDSEAPLPVVGAFYCSKDALQTFEQCVIVQQIDGDILTTTGSYASGMSTVRTMKRNAFTQYYSVDTSVATQTRNLTDLISLNLASASSSSFFLFTDAKGHLSSSHLQANLFPVSGGLFGVYTKYASDFLSPSNRDELQILNAAIVDVATEQNYFALMHPTAFSAKQISQVTSSAPSLVNYIPEESRTKISLLWFDLSDKGYVVAIESSLSYFQTAMVQSVLMTIIVSILISMGVSIVCSLFVTELILIPLSAVRDQIRNISQMKLNTNDRSLVYFQEYDYVVKQVKKLQRAMKSFSKFVPLEVIGDLISLGKEAQAGVVDTPITIFFLDIVDFTSMTESIPPSLLADTLTMCFEALAAVIVKNEGTIDKYIGDCLMAFWNAPRDVKAHPAKAVKAGIECQDAIRSMKYQFIQMGVPPVRIRIGMDYGHALVGMIGSNERLNYTCLGNAVNRASRLEGVNKYYKTEIIISDGLYEQVRHTIVCRPIDLCTVQGQKIPVILYEVLKEERKADTHLKELCYHYKIGFHYFLRGEYDLALQRFNKYKAAFPADHATKMIVDKCMNFISHRPALRSAVVTTTSK